MSYLLTVLFYTLPSILWIVYRIRQILSRSFGTIWFHAKQAWGPRSTSKDVAFTTHVFSGLSMMASMPYLTWLLNDGDDLSLRDRPLDRVLLTTIAIGLTIATLGVFWLVPVPHPDRFKDYAVEKRQFVRGLGYLYASALQYAAMSWTPLAFLVGSQQTAILAVGILLYTASCAICFSELLNIEWGATAWGKALLAGMPKTRGSARSNLTANTVAGKPESLFTGFSIFAATGVLAELQIVCMIWQLRGGGDPASTKMENLFVLVALYQSVVMGTGFFTVTQLPPSGQGNAEEEARLERLKILDLVLTQVWPILVIGLGAAYTGSATTMEFISEWTIWRAPQA